MFMMSAITTPPLNIFRAPLNITKEHVSLGGSWSRYFPEPDVDASHYLRLRIYTWEAISTLEWHVTKEEKNIKHYAVVTMYNASHNFWMNHFKVRYVIF